MNWDKLIAHRSNNMTGSRYLFIIAGQLLDGVISDSDLTEFSDEVIKSINLIADRW